MRKPALFTIILFGIMLNLNAQQGYLSGRITDTSEKKSLHLAAVSLLRKADTTLVSFTRTTADGKFRFPKTDTGEYVLFITYPKFADYMDKVELKGDLDLGDLFMTMKSKLLDEVVLKAQAAVRIKGDTTEFIADSFKV
ncbi:MAG: carboxypeptidase regulatory-like domain-containing protein, partial [Chitinophagaceae bacterium]|nr:carboxypeptidase regulatory-like domain-containing protein [Chitinophagaceae bacterium]